MKVAVRYYTRTGNTKKLADAIAQELGVEAKTTQELIDEVTDLLFLGSSVYAAGVDSEVKTFIASLDPSKVKKVVAFSTAALLPSTYSQVKQLLEKKGTEVSKEEFHCRGEFTIMHRGRPNHKDIGNAITFAKTCVDRVENQ